MQYWLYAFKIGNGNILIGKYDVYEEADIERDRLDKWEYEYADIVGMEWGKEPKMISSAEFEIYRHKTLVKKRNDNVRNKIK